MSFGFLFHSTKEKFQFTIGAWKCRI